MSKAVSNFNYDIDAITKYFIPLLEIEDTKNIFKRNYDDWFNLNTLLVEALKLYSEDPKIDFNKIFSDLTGKIPYSNSRRKKLEKEGGNIIFILFCDSIIDYLFNLKIDTGRRNLIKQTVIRFKEEAHKNLSKLS
ncbi:MAG: hypothetical protein XD76_1324 [candidate division TA06 bacterium 32_111]|uniref:Uncharacterized protein n=2 Tax=Bacteria candidate phyla TaxID=1783234 RepID=A0A101I1K3_UNCT6|nr:MAG: hypothetical protein XD76_1324 [candidate division TA06 bacterium 32_111]KUK86948.1 MAG: hypothetical protein XE03_1166 [candidate division TA06 bacterium 34_109]HAF07415.1 hypothetical protein [candidate division WOR-3 bacterium]HCP16617.1 hypothetical protein [candidate division WOR-3 bacterium]